MVTDNRMCYFPSGAEAPGNVPCRSDTNTWCCGETDVCLDNGLCLNAGHEPYLLSRGACTSKTWNGCTEHCTNSYPKGGSSITNIFFNGSYSLYCCGTPIAVGSDIVCPSESDDDGKPFTVKYGRPITGRALLSEVPSNKNLSSGNETSEGPIEEIDSAENCHDVAIGAGVGVPLGALALLFLIWALLERRRASRLRHTLTAPVSSIVPPVEAGSSQASGHTRKMHQMVELEGARPELDGGDGTRG